MSTKVQKLILTQITTNRNLLVPNYLICCYAYYNDDDPLVSDQFFDKLAVALAREWDELDHYHKAYLDIDMVKAATFTGQYPTIVEGAVEVMRKMK